MAKVDDWLTKDKLVVLEGWARDGLTNEQIAKNIGIVPSTLYEWKKKSEEFSNALKKGKEVADYEVEGALYKRAMGYTIRIMEQKVDRNGDVHDLERDLHIPGDVTAQIFWLKNRKKAEWREKVETPANPDELNKVQELLNKIKDESKK